MNGKINDPLTYKIIGCAMQVHSILGSGFQEVVYQRALKYEMEEQLLSFEREIEMPLYYKTQPVGKRRVDFLVEGDVLVELKAVSALNENHLAQGLNYLEAFKISKGLLINFGNRSLEVKRLRRSININPKIP